MSRRKPRRSVIRRALSALWQAREADVRRASTRRLKIVEHSKFIQELIVIKHLKSGASNPIAYLSLRVLSHSPVHIPLISGG